jgi:hypothetical protein
MMEHGRTDGNQTDIKNALRKAGCSVLVMSDLGKGAPDLLIGFQDGLDRFNVLVEIKMPNGRLTDDEKKFIENWKGYPVIIVRSAEQALKAIGKL